MKGLFELVFPPACAACGKLVDPAAPLCEACRAQLIPLPSPRCARCSEPGSFPEQRCPRCTAEPPPFTRAFAPFVHDGPLARAVHRFKYEDHPELAVPLAQLLAQQAAAFLKAHPGPLLALPLHRSRLRERKFDQAELLTRELGKLLCREVVADALERRRGTARQVGLSESERRANVEGAFSLSERGEVTGCELVLLDDVFTTGATARAAAAPLLAAGAKSVAVLALARAYSGEG